MTGSPIFEKKKKSQFEEPQLIQTIVCRWLSFIDCFSFIDFRIFNKISDCRSFIIFNTLTTSHLVCQNNHKHANEESAHLEREGKSLSVIKRRQKARFESEIHSKSPESDFRVCIRVQLKSNIAVRSIFHFSGKFHA